MTINVKDSIYFNRRGLDLESFVRLSPAIALLGGKIDYEGLTRCCELKVNQGTSSNSTIVIHQAGIHSGGVAGDHLLNTVIKVPKRLSWRQRRIFRRFAVLESPESGTVEGLDNELDHKFAVNVQTPDKILNPTIKRSLMNEETPTIYEKIKEKIESWSRRYSSWFV